MQRISKPAKVAPSTTWLNPFSDRVSDIPAFNRLGYLPDGVHDACFEQVIARFVTNPTRKALYRRLEKFLLKVIDSENYSYAYIGGEFTAAMESPREVDLILQTQEKFGIYAFRAMDYLLSLGLDTIQKEYSVRLRFWFDGSAEGLSSFRDYFEDMVPEKTNIIASTTKVKKGLLRIRL